MAATEVCAVALASKANFEGVDRAVGFRSSFNLQAFVMEAKRSYDLRASMAYSLLSVAGRCLSKSCGCRVTSGSTLSFSFVHR